MLAFGSVAISEAATAVKNSRSSQEGVSSTRSHFTATSANGVGTFVDVWSEATSAAGLQGHRSVSEEGTGHSSKAQVPRSPVCRGHVPSSQAHGISYKSEI